MTTPYRRGRYAEWAVRDQLRREGWLVMRSYASKGAYDLVAVKRGRDPVAIQVKASRTRMPTLGDMSPQERRELVELAERFDMAALFCGYHQGQASWLQLLGPGLDEVDEWTP